MSSMCNQTLPLVVKQCHYKQARLFLSFIHEPHVSHPVNIHVDSMSDIQQTGKHETQDRTRLNETSAHSPPLTPGSPPTHPTHLRTSALSLTSLTPGPPPTHLY
ncbi:hypothetical protein NQD34_002727 [Periophthalmus magnuspinnatus]|nr:hypothetical protein NQD34_002727 [Periophthalmus magnuspinnatus]